MKKYRAERIEKELCRIIGKLLYEEVKNPKISGLISITKAKITPDLKYSDISVSILNATESNEIVMEGLNEVRNFIRKRVSEEMNLRYTPEIRFKLDDTIEYGIRISKLIEETKNN